MLVAVGGASGEGDAALVAMSGAASGGSGMLVVVGGALSDGKYDKLVKVRGDSGEGGVQVVGW